VRRSWCRAAHEARDIGRVLSALNLFIFERDNAHALNVTLLHRSFVAAAAFVYV
jgi:hypothetical protein